MFTIYTQFIPVEVLHKLNTTVEDVTAEELEQYNIIYKEPKIKIDIMDKQNTCSQKFNEGINELCEDVIEYDDYVIITGTEYVPMMAIDGGARKYASDAILNFIEQRVGTSSGLCIITKMIDNIVSTGPIARICDYVVNYTDEFGACYMPQTNAPVKIVVSEQQPKKK